MRTIVLSVALIGLSLAPGAPADAGQGCGVGFHRGSYGRCTLNRERRSQAGSTRAEAGAVTAATGATDTAGVRVGAAGRTSGPTALLASVTRNFVAKVTMAALALERAGVRFTLHEYAYDPRGGRIGLQAADALGVPPERVLKALMTLVDGLPACAIVPSQGEL